MMQINSLIIIKETIITDLYIDIYNSDNNEKQKKTPVRAHLCLYFAGMATLHSFDIEKKKESFFLCVFTLFTLCPVALRTLFTR